MNFQKFIFISVLLFSMFLIIFLNIFISMKEGSNLLWFLPNIFAIIILTFAELLLFLWIIRKINIQRKEENHIKENEEKLFQYQKKETVVRLASGIAHDFNNLLTSIIGYTELMQEEISVASIKELAKEIRKAADKGSVLTGRLLTYSKKQPVKYDRIDFHQLIQNMEDTLKMMVSSNIQLHFSLLRKKILIQADYSQIEQVLLNLVLNSRDAMPSGGKIAILTAEKKLQEKTLIGERYLLPGRYILLTIRDNGTGMDEETLKYLFEPFFTKREPSHGRGLGLFMVQGIVENTGGAINVESELNKGSSFHIYLPVID